MHQPASFLHSVLVCHEDPLICLGLVAALQQSELGGWVHSCGHNDPRLPEFVGAADVVVTDYEHGLECCSLAERASDHGVTFAHVVVVSSRGGEHEIRAAIDRGVKGYLLLGCNLDVIVEGVRAASRGTRYLCSEAAHRIVDSMSREPLTARELQVLRCLVDGYVNKRICDELNIALGTVKAHVKSVFSKLGVATRTQAVSLARARGIINVPRAKFEEAAAKPRPMRSLPLSDGRPYVNGVNLQTLQI